MEYGPDADRAQALIVYPVSIVRRAGSRLGSARIQRFSEDLPTPSSAAASAIVLVDRRAERTRARAASRSSGYLCRWSSAEVRRRASRESVGRMLGLWAKCGPRASSRRVPCSLPAPCAPCPLHSMWQPIAERAETLRRSRRVRHECPGPRLDRMLVHRAGGLSLAPARLALGCVSAGVAVRVPPRPRVVAVNNLELLERFRFSAASADLGVTHWPPRAERLRGTERRSGTSTPASYRGVRGGRRRPSHAASRSAERSRTG
jgi:hypothetical protein